MLGLDPALERGDPFFGETAARRFARAAGSTPSRAVGAVRRRPARSVPDRGVANYYGVGGYRRPLSDARLRRRPVRRRVPGLLERARRRGRRQASCPSAGTDLVVHHPAWKAGVPRDAGTGWDFEDVRDHYLRALLGVDPDELRRVDHARYLELLPRRHRRARWPRSSASGAGRPRRAAAASSCGCATSRPGRRLGPARPPRRRRRSPTTTCAGRSRPIAVWLTDEGLAGVAVHVANDRPIRAAARALRLTPLPRRRGPRRRRPARTLELEPHGAISLDVEPLLGGFVDASWAYRFGPPGQDVIVATLESEGADGPTSSPRPSSSRPAARRHRDRGPARACRPAPSADGDRLAVTVRSRRLVDGVRLVIPGLVPADDAFTVEPGGERHISLRPTGTMVPGDDQPPSGAARLADGALDLSRPPGDPA